MEVGNASGRAEFLSARQARENIIKNRLLWRWLRHVGYKAKLTGFRSAMFYVPTVWIGNRESWNMLLRISPLHDSVHTTLVICGQWGGLDNDSCADSLDVLHTLASIENLR